MKTIVNQLNKVKPLNTQDLEAESTGKFLDFVLEQERTFENKSVAVFNSESGILHIGANLLSPRIICSILDSSQNEAIKSNLSSFNVICDFIQTKTSPFTDKSIDVAILGPALDKLKQTDLSCVECAFKFAKKVYCLFKAEHKQVLLNKFINSLSIGSVQVRMPGSSNYHKQNNSHSEYIVFKVDI